MERQSLLLFRMKNRWGLTALSLVLCLLAAPLASLGLFLPQFITLLPVVVLLLLGYVGPVSAVACSGVMVGLCGFLYRLAGGAAMALLLLPVLIAATVTVERRMGFFVSAGICAGVLFISMGAILGMISLLAGTDVVTALSSMMGGVFESLGELADPFLMMFVQTGALSLPSGVDLSQIAQSVVFSPEARSEMIAQIVYLLNLSFRLELPMQMTVGALGAGVLGQAALRKGLISRGVQVAYPPLRTWRLPNGWGRVLGGTFAVLYVAARLLPERMSVMAYIFGGVLTELFALQGVAAGSYMLYERKKGRGWVKFLFVVGYFVARPAAMILGIADQAFDIAKRRKALDTEDNPYDPRARM